MWSQTDQLIAALPDAFPFLIVALARALIAVVLLAAAAGKVRDVKRFARTVATSVAPMRVNAVGAARALIAAEVAIGSMLLVSWPLPLATWLATGLFLIFAAVMAADRLAGRRVLDCGCFGSRGSRSNTTWLAARAAFLAATAFASGLPGSAQLVDPIVTAWPAYQGAAGFVFGIAMLVTWAVTRSTLSAGRTRSSEGT